ncbi:hypothetical protein TSUD_00860 [Trifolium subterraneum]|nr:hypothetical protein TSUD_00860 [Trifolium subterraneum]
MDKPSSSSSKLSWLWVIEALASVKESPTSILQDLIDTAPVSLEDFSENTTEFIALRCLEEISSFLSSSSSTSDSSRIPLDSSRTCQHVLGQTLRKIKESILDGTLQLPDELKEKSGLFQMSRANMTCANEGKRHDRSRSVKGDGNSTYAEGMGAKENSAPLLLTDGNESSEKRLPGKNRLCSKRTRVDSADENSGSCLNEEEVCIIEHDEFLGSTKKSKCKSSTDFNSSKEKRVSRLGKEVSENSIEEIQISKNVGLHSEMNSMETLSDGSDISFNTTLTTQNTCEGETNDTVHVYPQQKKPNVASSNGGNANNNQHMANQSQPKRQQKKPKVASANQSQPKPQQKKPNVASSNVSQKPVASDKDVIDIVSEEELSSDSDMYHNEKIALTAKKDEFLRFRRAFGQDLPAMTESTGQNLCIKCNEVGQLLACKTRTCSLMMHKNCLGDSVQLDANGNFLCPFCEYSHTISEYLKAKKSASVAKEQLAIFKTTHSPFMIIQITAFLPSSLISLNHVSSLFGLSLSLWGIPSHSGVPSHSSISQKACPLPELKKLGEAGILYYRLWGGAASGCYGVRVWACCVGLVFTSTPGFSS